MEFTQLNKTAEADHVRLDATHCDASDLLDAKTACAEIGGSRPINPATLYRGVKAGIFPKPIHIGPNCVRWLRSESLAIVPAVTAADATHFVARLIGGGRKSASNAKNRRQCSRWRSNALNALQGGPAIGRSKPKVIESGKVAKRQRPPAMI